MNLIDGLDGLAAGISTIAAGSLTHVSIINVEQGNRIGYLGHCRGLSRFYLITLIRQRYLWGIRVRCS